MVCEKCLVLGKEFTYLIKMSILIIKFTSHTKD